MRLLDLFCGGGGAATGYHQAGFTDIVGVDIVFQPRYPFSFIEGDAMEYLREHGAEFDAIHASPPCQAYSVMHNLPWMAGREYPALIKPLLEMLDALGKPYVVENVMGARAGSATLRKQNLLDHGLEAGFLCGWSMPEPRPFYRHRLFAANWLWLAPPHRKHPPAYTTAEDRQHRDVHVGHAIVPIPLGHDLTPGQRQKYRDSAGRKYIKGADGQFHAYDTAMSTPAAPGGKGVRRFMDGDKERVDGRHGITRTLPRVRENGAEVGRLGEKKVSQSMGLHLREGQEHVPFSVPSIVGSEKSLSSLAAEALEIDWMTNKELTQAVPPCYTRFIGEQLLRHLGGGAC